MSKFVESGLQFSFAAPWMHVHQWDRLPAFTEGLGKVQSTRAVDFIGLHGSDLYFVEVKSFREHRIENKTKFTSGTLAAQIAGKVRDTMAGLVWAMERGHDSAALAPLLRHVFVGKSRCRVVFWLEEDRQPGPADRSVLGEAIKQRLRWLNPHVSVRSRMDPPLPGLTVTGAAAEAGFVG